MIKQGYSSLSLTSFDFVKKFNLNSSINYNKPIIIFGLYNSYDYELLKKCNSHITIFWAGVDTLRCPQYLIDYMKKLNNIRHVTTLIPVKNKLNSMGIDCEMLMHWNKNNSKFNAVKKGNKIYSYIPNISNRGHKIDTQYYGFDIIKSLNIKNELLIGGQKTNFKEKLFFWKKSLNKVSMEKWYDGMGAETYSKCFVGLSLSHYAGGGTSIIEMGLCGIKVITNLLDAPNVIKWNTKDDIINSINKEKNNIGKIDTKLSEQVHNSLSSDDEWLIIK